MHGFGKVLNWNLYFSYTLHFRKKMLIKNKMTSTMRMKKAKMSKSKKKMTSEKVKKRYSSSDLNKVI